MDIPYQSPRGHALPPIYVDGPNPPDRYQSPRHHRLNSKFSPTLPTIPNSIPTGVDIPGSDRYDFHVPPPLPPPRYPMGQAPTDYRESHRNGFSVSSFAESLYDEEDSPNYKRRESNGTIVGEKDEGYSSLSFSSSIRSPKSRDSLQGGRLMSHDMYQFRSSSDAYDNSLLKKLDSRRVGDNRSPTSSGNRSRSALSASLSDVMMGPRHVDRLHTQIKPLSLPIQTRLPTVMDSPRLSDTPLSAASPYGGYHGNHRSPGEDNGQQHLYSQQHQPPPPSMFDRSPLPLRTRRTNSGSIPDDSAAHTPASGGDYDTPMEDADAMEMDGSTSQLRRLDINAESPYYGGGGAGGHSPYASSSSAGSGLKRRASSPLPDDQPPPLPGLHLNTSNEMLRRGGAGPRVSPTPRHGSAASSAGHQGSISSIASSAGPRSGSYASGISSLASAMSAQGFGRRSPPPQQSMMHHDTMNGAAASNGALSPAPSAATTADTLGSPYMTPISAVSPRSQAAVVPQTPHQRTLSALSDGSGGGMAATRKLGVDVLKSTQKMQGFHMCECCPKKPKRFETAEELNAHAAEKQYECSFCGNRFKNKNEAERHQNSLHVRRHSWSCVALSSFDRAFHESTARPGEADTCGYCGEDFSRTGPVTSSGLSPSGGGGSGHARSPAGGVVRQATDQDWDERIRHLQEVHKFRECNSSKKFFRADHFRQHLKHSHAGTSGKWTNMLENACMMDEDQSPR